MGGKVLIFFLASSQVPRPKTKILDALSPQVLNYSFNFTGKLFWRRNLPTWTQVVWEVNDEVMRKISCWKKCDFHIKVWLMFLISLETHTSTILRRFRDINNGIGKYNQGSNSFILLKHLKCVNNCTFVCMHTHIIVSTVFLLSIINISFNFNKCMTIDKVKGR